jgi:hypothetical protein
MDVGILFRKRLPGNSTGDDDIGDPLLDGTIFSSDDMFKLNDKVPGIYGREKVPDLTIELLIRDHH